ncbi:hypothetical protein FOZ62_012351, partial [Perkinsus olseni]
FLTLVTACQSTGPRSVSGAHVSSITRPSINRRSGASSGHSPQPTGVPARAHPARKHLAKRSNSRPTSGSRRRSTGSRALTAQRNKDANSVTLSLSLGSATIRQYLSGLRNYITYVRCLSDISGDTIPVFPIDPMVIVSWISTFRNGRTAANYVCHLRKWALLLGEEASGLNSALVSTALRGQIREHPGGTRRMKAIQLALLRQLIPGISPLNNGGLPWADPDSGFRSRRPSSWPTGSYFEFRPSFYPCPKQQSR